MLVTSETFKIDCFIICFVTSGSGCQWIQFILISSPVRLPIYNLFHHLSGCGHFGPSELTRPSAPPSYHMLEYLGWQNLQSGKRFEKCTTCLNTLDGKIFNQEKDLKSVPHAWILRCWNIQSGNICFSIHICICFHIIARILLMWKIVVEWSEGAPVHVTWVVFYGHGHKGAMPHEL